MTRTQWNYEIVSPMSPEGSKCSELRQFNYRSHAPRGPPGFIRIVLLILPFSDWISGHSAIYPLEGLNNQCKLETRALYNEPSLSFLGFFAEHRLQEDKCSELFEPLRWRRPFTFRVLLNSCTVNSLQRTLSFHCWPNLLSLLLLSASINEEDEYSNEATTFAWMNKGTVTVAGVFKSGVLWFVSLAKASLLGLDNVMITL